MPKFDVYYRVDIPRDISECDDVTFEDVRSEKDYRYLRSVEAPVLNDVSYLMQGEVWSPNGEARDLILSKGLSHTSLKVKIGVGFPEYSTAPRRVGNTLTLFGPKKELESIDIKEECKDIAPYLAVGDVEKANDTGEYYSFRRFRLRQSPENRIRRSMKRKGYTQKEAEEKYLPLIRKGKPDIKYPYVYFESESTKQAFPLLIKREKVSSMAESFNTFGFDQGQTRQGVPM